jgi:hypothetical protein
MRKIWLGLAFAAIIAEPAPAQQHVVECANELGLRHDASYDQKIQSAEGRTLRRWYFSSEAQQAVFNDCVARKASLAGKPSPKGPPRVSR